MRLLEHQGQFVIRAKSQEDLCPRLLEIFRNEISGYAPDNLNVSGDTISFTGYILGPRTRLLAGVSRGTISVTSADEGAIVHYRIIYFIRFTVIFIIMALALSISAGIWTLPFTGCFLFCFIGLTSIVRSFGFNHFIKKCTKKADATDIKRIKTITLSK